MSRDWSYSGRIDRKCQHFWECPPPLRPKRAAQTAAQDFAPADTPKKQQIKRKRDTSNEVRKGTFLKRFDNGFVLHLTFVSAARIVKGFARDGTSHRLTERSESSTHDPSTTVLS